MTQSNYSSTRMQEWFSFSFRTEAITMAYNVLYDLIPASRPDGSPRTPSLSSQTAPTAQGYLLIPQHAEPVPASGPLHLLLPQSSMLFLKCSFIRFSVAPVPHFNPVWYNITLSLGKILPQPPSQPVPLLTLHALFRSTQERPLYCALICNICLNH